MRLLSKLTAAFVAVVISISGMSLPVGNVRAADNIAHDPSCDVNAEGVGNPFNFGERNTPADASTAEIRAINHKMTVQEVKYALYKEIDEHWDLLTVRLGQAEREKVYALFLGVGTRESTLGGNGDGADLETAYDQGFGVSSAHAYGTLQTAVTAFADCDPTFMKEEDVPEMFQYSLSESTFYDAIISNHMGIRKILHFVHSAIVDYNLSGYQVVRAALKGHNTGWADFDENNVGYYANYPDEIIAQAKWYYEEGHLYDNEFSWTGNQAIESYRSDDAWDWWGDGQPSLAEIGSSSGGGTGTTATTTSGPKTTTTTTRTTASSVDPYRDFTVSPSYVDIAVGDKSVQISAPAGSTFASNDKEIVTVDESGVITPLREGMAQIAVYSPYVKGDFRTVTVNVKAGNPNTSEIEQNTLMGDVDLNGAATIADAVLLVKFLCGMESFTAKQSKAADMDYNGKLTAADLTMLKRYLISTGR